MANSSLVLLGEIAVVVGAVAVPTAQGVLGSPDSVAEVDTSLYLQITAAVTDAAALKFFGFGSNPDDNVRYLGCVLLIIQCMESLNGFGPPDTGAQFADTAIASDICCALNNAIPARWTGQAADRYAGNNSGQQDYLALLWQADEQIAHILKIQASQVEQVREGLAGVQNAIIGAIGVALALAVLVWALKAAGLIEQEQAALGVLRSFIEYSALIAAGAALGLVGFLIACGLENVSAFNHARNKYETIAANKNGPEKIPPAGAIAEVLVASGEAAKPSFPRTEPGEVAGQRPGSRLSGSRVSRGAEFGPRRVNRVLRGVPDWTA